MPLILLLYKEKYKKSFAPNDLNIHYCFVGIFIDETYPPDEIDISANQMGITLVSIRIT